MHVSVVLVQPLHAKLPTALSHVTSSAAAVPVVGGAVWVVLASVHFGIAGTGCHVTAMVAGALAPAALVATTEYVTDPSASDVVVHCASALMQFVHRYAVGAFVHDAVSVTLLPTNGVVVDADATQSGTESPPEPAIGEHIATGIEGGP